MLTLGASAQAAPLAGTVISNQASASFSACLDDTCSQTAETQSVTSNLVETVVQPVPAFTLEASQLKPAVSGAPVRFPHSLNNTGNVDDSYQLCVVDVAASVDEWAVYPDTDNDGQPDIGDPLFDSSSADASGCWTSPTRVVAAGEQLDLVIEAIATGSTASTLELFELSATSDKDSSQTQTNKDEVVFPDGPVVEVVKSLSQNLGPSPNQNLTVSLSYRNISPLKAENLEIQDLLPTQYTNPSGTTISTSGMTYVSGSARWSLDTTTPLTDADDGNQTVNGENIDYCAYETGCSDRVKAIISSLPAGARATLTFEVNIDAGIPAGSRVLNTADYKYLNEAETDSFPDTGFYSTNTAVYTIIDRARDPGVVANNTGTDSSVGVDDALENGNVVDVASIGQGGTAVFENFIWNTGDGTDSFDIAIDKLKDREGNSLTAPFPEGTAFQLFRSDGATPLTDTTGSGTVDTGPIPIPDSSDSCPARFVSHSNACGIKVVLKAILPPDATGGPYDVTKVATSNTDASVSNAVTDRLTAISENSVDITNNAEADGNGGAPGEGIGPETAPVNENQVAPGNTTTFNLFINNTSDRQDSYALAYSDTLSPFEANQLPDGWQVEFFNDGGSGDCSALGEAISTTPLIPADKSHQVCAQVTAPANATGGDSVDLYFRAQSPTTNAQDIKFDRVTVTAGAAISLTPDQQSQVEPGSAVVYTHQVRNTGNVVLTELTLTASADANSDDWAVVLYQDTDANGEWSPGDTRLNADGDLSGNLAPGESFTVFARIFAPAETSLGDVNIQVLTVEAAQNVSDTATDTTTANKSDIVITKRQSLDSQCDGNPDSGSFVFTSFDVAPDECVIYKLVATNQGVEHLSNVTISDRTQSFTVYQANAFECTTPNGSCTETQPPNGGVGDIVANAGTLAPGEQATLTFGLKVQ
ncbi:hypothetical protein QWY74_08575 [Halomonas almeriensis]|uniref:hypothetical protein n=1 Tax=Halomonas almeriensis TaxID=308163 RepID=UPI0025B4C6F2|nr:hypothetical protein [Halomonas almeriensis]MDN3553517.1 hypothetical protein [Halomonas almeriensis]